jgi:hypothetical protein
LKCSLELIIYILKFDITIQKHPMSYFNGPFKCKSNSNSKSNTIAPENRIIASREPLNDLLKRMNHSPPNSHKSIDQYQGAQIWNAENYHRSPITYNKFDGTPGGAWKNPYSN